MSDLNIEADAVPTQPNKKSILKRHTTDISFSTAPFQDLINQSTSGSSQDNSESGSSFVFDKSNDISSPTFDHKKKINRPRGNTENGLVSTSPKTSYVPSTERRVSFSADTPLRTALEILQDQKSLGIQSGTHVEQDIASQLEELRLVKLNAFKRAFINQGLPTVPAQTMVEKPKDWYEKRKVISSGIMKQSLHHELLIQDLQNSIKEGYLNVKSWNSFFGNAWKRRYCVVKDKWLIIFKEKDSLEAIHIIPLAHCVLDSYKLTYNAFSLHRLGKYKLYVFEAESAESKAAWMEDILKAISVSWEIQNFSSLKTSNTFVMQNYKARRHSISDSKFGSDMKSIRIFNSVQVSARHINSESSDTDKSSRMFSPYYSSNGSNSKSTSFPGGSGNSVTRTQQKGPNVEFYDSSERIAWSKKEEMAEKNLNGLFNESLIPDIVSTKSQVLGEVLYRKSNSRRSSYDAGKVSLDDLSENIIPDSIIQRDSSLKDRISEEDGIAEEGESTIKPEKVSALSESRRLSLADAKRRTLSRKGSSEYSTVNRSRKNSSDDKSFKKMLSDSMKNKELILTDELLKNVLDNLDRNCQTPDSRSSSADNLNIMNASDLEAVIQLFG